MKIYGIGSVSRTLVLGLIVLVPGSIVLAQDLSADREDQQRGPAGMDGRLRNGNRPQPGPREQAARAARSVPNRGQQGDVQRNQAFRPNFDKQGQARRTPPMTTRNSRPGQAARASKPQSVANFNRRQPQQPPIMVFEFTNPENCMPCRKVAPIVESLIDEGYPILIVDLGKKPELAEKFRIESIPTFVRVENGRESGRLEGAQSEDDLAAFCEGEDLSDDENGDDEDDDDEDAIYLPPKNEPQFVNRSGDSGRGQVSNEGRRRQENPRAYMNSKPPIDSNRGPVAVRRPTSGNQGKLPDNRFASNQRPPSMNDGRSFKGNPRQFGGKGNPAQTNQEQVMDGRPSNPRRIPPIGKGRSTQGNPTQTTNRAAAKVGDPEASLNRRRSSEQRGPEGPDAG